jgi:hypothetical protein
MVLRDVEFLSLLGEEKLLDGSFLLVLLAQENHIRMIRD